MELKYLLALLRIPFVGVVSFYKLIEHFGSAQAVFEADKGQLLESKLLRGNSIDALLSFDESALDATFYWLEAAENHIISYYDDVYPTQLKHIYDPPPLLYVKGDVSLLSSLQLAVVGSRNPTATGIKNTYNFVADLAKDITITSGLAIGIDSVAHQAALENEGKTIAICGTGLDLIYPARNKQLARAIVENGALVSEFALGTASIAANFPRRNRIITGLSAGLLVSEAALKSGSMVSSRLALEHNKDIFAIPGSIHNPLSEGPHQLIKEGAYLVTDATDITEVLGINHRKNGKKTKEATQSDSILLKYIDYDGVTIDELVNKSGLSIEEVNHLLMQLELESVIEKTIYNTYIRL